VDDLMSVVDDGGVAADGAVHERWIGATRHPAGVSATAKSSTADRRPSTALVRICPQRRGVVHGFGPVVHTDGRL